MFRVFLSSLFLLFSGLLHGQIKPVEMVQPDYPDILHDTFTEGKASIQATIATDGSVKSAEIRDATRPEFGEAAVAAALQWRFEPVLKDGVAIEKKVVIPFVFNLSAEQKLNRQFGRSVFKEMAEDVPVVAMEDLAERPRPLQFRRPRYPAELVGSEKRGRVTVRFIIDTDGRVINPQVIEVSAREFVKPALFTVIMTEFPPIQHDGQLVYVEAERSFDFFEGMENSPPEGRRGRGSGPSGG